MDKKTFIKTSALIMSGLSLTGLPSCNDNEKNRRTNWAGNLEYSTDKLSTPADITELQTIVRNAPKIRALGSRHSFNRIADSNGQQLSTSRLNEFKTLDAQNNMITVQAGFKYGEFCEYLDKNGFALHNLASLPHISVAGACMTSTHGSGINNGSLATAVSALSFVNAMGNIVSMTRDHPDFNGAVVALGALGIVTVMRLDLQPTFRMKQWVYLNMPMAELERNFESIMSAGYSVSLFTDWKNKNINQVWIKDKSDAAGLPEFHGAKPATHNMHPLADLSPENCTDQMGVEGPWYERMPHFKMGFTPSSGKELQSEYFIPFEHAYEGMMAVEKLHDKISPHLFISEIRAIAADELWMSPFYKRRSIAFHFTWKQEWEEVKKLLPMIEEALEPFEPKPHWGKLFTMDASKLQRRYERLDDFKALIKKYDPDGKFRNAFINENLF